MIPLMFLKEKEEGDGKEATGESGEIKNDSKPKNENEKGVE